MTTTLEPLRAHDGERADLPGLRSRYLVRSEQTGDRFALIEHIVPPHRLAAPMHTHTNEDEFSYVIGGRIGVQVGDDVFELGPGDSIFKPRGVPHAFWNPGDDDAVVAESLSPGRFDQYFLDLVPAFGDRGPDLAAMATIQARYGLTMDLESIPRLCERYHVQP